MKHKDNNYYKHAMQEFKACGWLNDNGDFKDKMQMMICEHVLSLLDVFADEGHSGTTAPYAIGLFKSLASFEPIGPITGEDWEWVEVGTGLFQNKRCGHVFKDVNVFNGQAYDMEGKIFYDLRKDEDGEEYKSCYTCIESRVPITFPYTPVKEYLERPDEEPKEVQND
jgi:hypothetical protein